jgi:hypothetical protein
MAKERKYDKPGRPRKVSTPNGKKGSKVSCTGRHNRHSLEYYEKQIVNETVDSICKSSVQFLNKEDLKKCVYCGKVLKGTAIKSKSQTCNQICRVALRRKLDKEAEETKQILHSKKHNRICRCGCNEPCWPNYFWKKGHEPFGNNPEDNDISFYNRIS